jgi:hypothetical protein
LIRYGAIAGAIVSALAIAGRALLSRNDARQPASAVTSVTTNAPAQAAGATTASGAPVQPPPPTASIGIAAKVKQLLKSKQRPAQKEQSARPSVGYRDDPYR